MMANPLVALLAYRLSAPLTNIEVRGRVVEMTEEGAEKHLDELNLLYGCGPKFFGDSVDAELRHKFNPIKVRIRPIRVRMEG